MIFRVFRIAALWLALVCPALASQATLVTPSAPLPMSSLASFLNTALLSVGSCNSGATAPANGTSGAAFPGECWINTAANPWVFSYTADGTHWSEFGTLNTSSFVWRAASSGVVFNSGGPFVILSTGQSNFTRTPAFSWTPNPSATLWNFSGTDGNVGTAYGALSNSTINVSWKLASDIADSNPTRQVCLINVSFAGESISHWLPGTSSPDIYQNIQNNISAALTACGATKINLFEWWQGESDASPLSATYVANFATVMARFWTNSWFPQETPVIIHGISSGAQSTVPSYDSMNDLLLGVVNADPDKRRFVYDASLVGSTYWDSSTLIHMTGQGYFSAGAMAASAFLNGPGRVPLQNVIVDPVTGFVTIGQPAVSPDPVTVNANPAIQTPSSIGAMFNIISPDVQNALYAARSFGGVPGYIGLALGGTTASPTAITTNTFMNVLGGRGYDGSAVSLNQGQFGIVAAENWGPTAHGTFGTLYLTPSGTLTNAEYFRWTPGCMKYLGVTSGSLTFCVPAAAGSNTVTWPAGTVNFSATGPGVVRQASGGAAFTVSPVAAADMPNPGPSTLGGIESLSCAAHNWLNSISVLGVPACAQPAVGDLSGLGTNVLNALGNQANGINGILTTPSGLTANGVVYGGGSGTAPAATAVGTAGQIFIGVTSSPPAWANTGTGVLTALAVTPGTAGSFVVNGGALGTPSGGTGTNITSIPTANLINTLQAAQEPAHTGACTNSAGSLALSCQINTNVLFSAGNINAITQNSTFFVTFGGAYGTESFASTVISTPGTFKSFYASTSAAPAAGQTFAMTMRKNATDQTVTCTISNPATTCNDTTHSFTVAAGDLIDVKIATSATSGTMNGMGAGITLVTTSP